MHLALPLFSLVHKVHRLLSDLLSHLLCIASKGGPTHRHSTQTFMHRLYKFCNPVSPVDFFPLGSRGDSRPVFRWINCSLIIIASCCVYYLTEIAANHFCSRRGLVYKCINESQVVVFKASGVVFIDSTEKSPVC